MRHCITFFAFFALCLGAFAAPGDTTRVSAHNSVILDHYGDYDVRVAFPAAGTSYQKILLKYTLGVYGSGGAGYHEWDYTTRVFALRPTGAVDTAGNPIKEEVELGRVITPYAGGFANSWTWDYTFDITDYEPLLHDSVDIRFQFQGYQHGFDITLNFEFVEGTPPHEVLDVIRIYEGGSPYGDPNNSIENFLSEKPVTIPTGTEYAKFVYRPSGHGFGGNENCAEFCPKYFYVFTDNQQRGQGLIWNETCGNNPLYPQPGTWLYDRANWCPGTVTGDFAFNLTPYLSAGAHTVNVNMQPFTNINNNSCSYNISGHLFAFAEASFTNDAELVQILSPSNDKNFGRFNPICMDAKVIIRNYGSNPLTSAKLIYGIEGGAENEVTWTGNLEFLESDTFLFQVADWTNAGISKKFNVRIAEANGTADQYAGNNKQSSNFDVPPVYPSTFVLEYKTNNVPSDNAYKVTDFNGNVLYQRSSHTANTTYKDTMTFAGGCYRFEFTDEQRDGLNFWANNAGSGLVRFRRADANAVLKTFKADFGTSLIQYFTVGGTLSIPEQDLEGPTMELFPNPANDQLNIRTNGMNGEAWLHFIDMNGKQVRSEKVMLQDGSLSRDISGLAKGVYVLRLVNEKTSIKQKFVKE